MRIVSATIANAARPSRQIPPMNDHSGSVVVIIKLKSELAALQFSEAVGSSGLEAMDMQEHFTAR